MLRILLGFRSGWSRLSCSQSNSVFTAAEFLRRSMCSLLGLRYDGPSFGGESEIQILLTISRVPKYISACLRQSCILQKGIDFTMVRRDIILSHYRTICNKN